MSVLPDNPAYAPSVNDVALLLRTRTAGDMALGGDTGSDVTTFTASTRPTAAEVERLILTAESVTVGELRSRLNDEVPARYDGSVKHAIALYAALLVQMSFFRESTTTDERNMWRELRDEVMNGIVGASSGGSGSSGRRYSIGTLTIGTTLAKVSPYANSDPVVGIDV